MKKRVATAKERDNDLRNDGNICSTLARIVLLHESADPALPPVPDPECRETCPTSRCVHGVFIILVYCPIVWRCPPHVRARSRVRARTLLFPLPRGDPFWSTGETSAAAARRWTAAERAALERQVLVPSSFRGSPSPANYACLFLPPSASLVPFSSPLLLVLEAMKLEPPTSRRSLSAVRRALSLSVFPPIPALIASFFFMPMRSLFFSLHVFFSSRPSNSSPGFDHLHPVALVPTCIPSSALARSTFPSQLSSGRIY